MSNHGAHFELSSHQKTEVFAKELGAFLKAGDTILLDGSIGAGKTYFARCLIQSLLTVPEDVPSPTFTLVQTYETRAGTVWHADLYRIGSIHEIEELGLTEAFEDAVCMVEWPDRLGELTPKNALNLQFSTTDQDEVRMLCASWVNPRWNAPMSHWKTI